jgi:hypothetical protein
MHFRESLCLASEAGRRAPRHVFTLGRLPPSSGPSTLPRSQRREHPPRR